MDTMNPTFVFVDYETFSVPDLRVVGAHVYASKCEILICCYASLNSRICRWVPAFGQDIPDILKSCMRNPFVKLVAHNASFEAVVSQSKHAEELGIPKIDPGRWVCTAVLAASLGLPPGLEKVCEVLKLPEKFHKDTKGDALKRWFTRPRNPSKNDSSIRRIMKPGDEKSEQFIDYCAQDVEAERAVWGKIGKYLEMGVEQDGS